MHSDAVRCARTQGIAKPSRPSAEQPSRRASGGAVGIVHWEVTQIEFLQREGYRRLGSPRSGFRFPGAPARGLPRLRALRLPPAWTDVAIPPNPRARLQALPAPKQRARPRETKLSRRMRRSPRARRLARAFTIH